MQRMLRQSVISPSSVFALIAMAAIAVTLLAGTGYAQSDEASGVVPSAPAAIETETETTDESSSTEASPSEAESFSGGTAAVLEKVAGDQLRHMPNYTRASDVAHASDNLNIIVTVICLIFGIPIFIVTIVFVIMFRRREGRMEPEKAPSHSTPLELTWSIIPLIIVIGIFVLGFRGYLEMKEPRGDFYRVDVTAHSWRWEFTYEDGTKTTDILHLPVDRNIRLLMTSGDGDVIHSMFIPAFRVKQDVVPDRNTDLWFKPTVKGIYDFYCTEYCGLEHSTMIGQVHVHGSWEAFQQALADARVTPEDLLPPDVRKALAGLVEEDLSIDNDVLRESLLNEFADASDQINAYFDYLALTDELGREAEAEAKATNTTADPALVAEKVAAQLKEKYADNPELVAMIEKVADLMEPLWERGRRAWSIKGCNSCHTLDGSPGTGPSFKGIWGEEHQFTDGSSAVVDENYVRESILYPQRKLTIGYGNVMQSYQGSITDSEINALIALIRHLGDEQAD